MSDYIEIHWTSGSIDEARRIARYLVQERLVACAQIVPWIESIFVWNNQLETSQESKIVFKTKREKFEKVRDIIYDNSTYEVPEITFSSIEGGNEDYLKWIDETLMSSQKPKS